MKSFFLSPFAADPLCGNGARNPFSETNGLQMQSRASHVMAADPVQGMEQQICHCDTFSDCGLPDLLSVSALVTAGRMEAFDGEFNANVPGLSLSCHGNVIDAAAGVLFFPFEIILFDVSGYQCSRSGSLLHECCGSSALHFSLRTIVRQVFQDGEE